MQIVLYALANHCRQEGKRYLKSLKNTALPLGENTLVEVLEIGLQNNEILLQLCGTEREEKVLMPTATERRNTLMITAEEMRYNGMSFRDIAQQMELPERTVRSWVSFIGERAVRSEGREVVSVEEREARSEEREGVSVEGGGVSEKHEEASSTPDTSGLTNPPIKSFSPVMVSVDEPQVEKEIPLTGSLRVGSEASINTTMPLRGSPTDAAVSTESPL
ncbi:MAG: hypothetical protein M0D57_08860 [Sphingobacteriales bacterium JAD_PAG50586_3]|nr:MAG: hypothetical protein M0D57_08860 [Sphingobacteriales bacterium JAD_PAG50586_3]